MNNQNHNIRKKEAFGAFIRTIESGSVCHWAVIAEALGVNKDTITEWKKKPEARQATAKGISYAIEKMEETGKSDWRMWQAKLRMFRIDFDNKKDSIEDNTNYSDGLVIYVPERNKEIEA